MKKLPVFSIMGMRVPVKLIKGLANSKGVVGYYDPSNRIIAIDHEHYNTKEAMHTLMHELAHAWWIRSGLYQTKLSYDTIEIICETIATVMVENFDIKPR